MERIEREREKGRHQGLLEVERSRVVRLVTTILIDTISRHRYTSIRARYLPGFISPVIEPVSRNRTAWKNGHASR